jgi:hypothetical protein
MFEHKSGSAVNPTVSRVEQLANSSRIYPAENEHSASSLSTSSAF